MARFLFTSTDFPAHIDWGGYLATAVHLWHGGHEVLWATGPRVAPLIAGAGLATREIPLVDPYRGGRNEERLGPDCDRSPMVELWRIAFRASPRTGMSVPPRLAQAYAHQIRVIVDCWLQEHAVAASTDAVIALIDEWRPDVVLAEPMMLPAALAAEARRVRFAGCGWPGPVLTVQPVPGLNGTAQEIAESLARLRGRLGLPDAPARPDPDLFFMSPDLQVVYFPPDWYGDLGARAAPRVAFVGSHLPEAKDASQDGCAAGRDRPLVVMAAASSYLPAPETLQAMFEAVGRVGATGIFGGCEELRARMAPLPDHVRWEPWVAYDRVLPHASAIVHHGGLGTTHAAVRAATPQVLLPGPVDQCIHADAIARSGAGVTHVGPINADSIARALRAVLSSSTYRDAAERLRRHFSAYGGVPRAADLLVALAGRTA